MRKFLEIAISLLLLTVGLPSNSYASSNGEVLVWRPYEMGLAFELGSYNHSDLSKKIKWYSWNPEDKYFVSFGRPFTFRLAQEVKITDKNASCTSVPILVRREISEKEVTDKLNQTTLQFFQADFGFNKAITSRQIISRPIIYTVGPSSWKDEIDQEMKLDVPICSDSIGKSISELVGNQITINLRLSYSADVDANLMNIDPKCSEIAGGKCMYYSSVIRIPIQFNQSSLSLEKVKTAYQETIDKEKDYLQAKPCDVPYASYDKQSNSYIMVKDNKALCESSRRNLNFLNSEISRASKLPQPNPSTTVSPKPTEQKSQQYYEKVAKQEIDAWFVKVKSNATLSKKSICFTLPKISLPPLSQDPEKNEVSLSTFLKFIYGQMYTDILEKIKTCPDSTSNSAEASSIPVPIESARSTPSSKTTTITCKKGSSKKTVKGKNPKCPSGYTKI